MLRYIKVSNELPSLGPKKHHPFGPTDEISFSGTPKGNGKRWQGMGFHTTQHPSLLKYPIFVSLGGVRQTTLSSRTLGAQHLRCRWHQTARFLAGLERSVETVCSGMSLFYWLSSTVMPLYLPEDVCSKIEVSRKSFCWPVGWRTLASQRAEVLPWAHDHPTNTKNEAQLGSKTSSDLMFGFAESVLSVSLLPVVLKLSKFSK